MYMQCEYWTETLHPIAKVQKRGESSIETVGKSSKTESTIYVTHARLKSYLSSPTDVLVRS